MRGILFGLVLMLLQGCATTAFMDSMELHQNSPDDNVLWTVSGTPGTIDCAPWGEVITALDTQWIYEFRSGNHPLYLVLSSHKSPLLTTAEKLQLPPSTKGIPPLHLIVAGFLDLPSLQPQENSQGQPTQAIMTFSNIRYDSTLSVNHVWNQISESPVVTYRINSKTYSYQIEAFTPGPQVFHPEMSLVVFPLAVDIVLSPIYLVGLGIILIACSGNGCNPWH